MLVLLTLGAVVRLTRLVTEDVVLQPARAWVVRHRDKPRPAPESDVPEQDEEPDEDWLVYLLHCRWCASIWIAAAATPIVYNWPDRWFVQIPILALTASLLAGLSARWE